MLEVSGSSIDGTCVQECASAEDCPVTDEALEVSTCNNEGRCRVYPRPARVRILDPENDTLLPEGTRTVRLSGEVETVAEQVKIDVKTFGRPGCSVGGSHRTIVKNPEKGRRVTLSFVVEDVELDPGLSTIQLRADVGGSVTTLDHLLEVPCPGCAEVKIEVPPLPFTAPQLLLPELSGTVSPAGVSAVIWRVRGESGDVFDGLAEVRGGRFSVHGVPLFAGFNRLQVLVTGVGTGLGEARCSAPITSAVVREEGLRAILSWDGSSSDLDLHLIGPGGRFGDPMTSLSSRSRSPSFGGTVRDDFDGFGPELLTVPSLPDGVYGLIVEAVIDDRDPGSNAILRVLHEGRSTTTGPIGPEFLSSDRAELWIAGILRVSGGAASFEPLGDLVPASAPPQRPPSDWPAYY